MFKTIKASIQAAIDSYYEKQAAEEDAYLEKKRKLFYAKQAAFPRKEILQSRTSYGAWYRKVFEIHCNRTEAELKRAERIIERIKLSQA